MNIDLSNKYRQNKLCRFCASSGSVLPIADHAPGTATNVNVLLLGSLKKVPISGKNWTTSEQVKIFLTSNFIWGKYLSYQDGMPIVHFM